MNDETNKAVELAQKAAAEQNNPVEKNEDAEAAGADAKPEPGTTEWYEAQLKKERQEKENYKQGLLNEKDKAAKNKETPSADESRIAEIVASEIAKLRNEMTSSSVDQELASYNLSDSKAAYVKSVYENQIRHTGTDPVSIRKDLENALLIADKEVILKRDSEMALALENRRVPHFAASGSNQEREKTQSTFFSKEQESAIDKLAKKTGIAISAKDVEETIKRSQGKKASE